MGLILEGRNLVTAYFVPMVECVRDRKFLIILSARKGKRRRSRVREVFEGGDEEEDEIVDVSRRSESSW